MSQFIENMQDRIKVSSAGVALYILRVITGVILGLTFALVGDEIMKFGHFSFALVLVTVTGVVLRISRKWKFVGLAVFNLICVLVAMLLRMYILLAPGA
jgi:hypothetical protein